MKEQLKRDMQENLNLFSALLESEINATPTGKQRELLTEANIFIMKASENLSHLVTDILEMERQ